MAQVSDGFAGNDDEDLPLAAPATAQPRNPANGQFVQPAAPAAPEAPVHVHSPYMLAKANQYGVAVSPDMTPETLGVILTSIERQQAGSGKTADTAAQENKPQKPPVDWGEDDQGKPLTEDQAKAVYPRAVFNAIKKSHQFDDLAEQNKTLRESIEQDRRERQAKAAERSLNKVLASRPDLFGDNPAMIQPGSVEAHRRQAVINHLNGLVAAKQQTTLEQDATAALTMFGAPAKPAKPGKVASPTDLAAGYRAAELARPSGRNGSEVLNRRQLMIEQEAARQRENGSPVGVVSDDDDDDLPDPRKG